jgi:hypothetical protein
MMQIQVPSLAIAAPQLECQSAIEEHSSDIAVSLRGGVEGIEFQQLRQPLGQASGAHSISHAVGIARIDLRFLRVRKLGYVSPYV